MWWYHINYATDPTLVARGSHRYREDKGASQELWWSGINHGKT